jgi:hypothetical protein
MGVVKVVKDPTHTRAYHVLKRSRIEEAVAWHLYHVHYIFVASQILWLILVISCLEP